MPTIRTIYLGDLRTEAEHVQSGRKVITDAPLDNQGKGQAFSPSDLLCASLGSCMITIAGIAARTHGINIDGTRLEITKIMAANPRRVSEVQIQFFMPGISYSDKEKQIIENAARTCPVALSIHPDIKQELQFNYHD